MASLDIQIRREHLTSLVRALSQTQINQTEFPPFGTVFLDHIDVLDTAFNIDGGTAVFRVSVSIFTVSLTALKANINGTPPEALRNPVPAQLLLRLSTAATDLKLECSDVTSDNPLIVSAADQIKTSFGVQTFALKEIFAKLGLNDPIASRIEGVADSLVIRFDPSGPVADRLQPGQGWCLFAPPDTMKALVKNKLQPLLASVAPTMNPAYGWKPHDNTPRVTVDGTFQHATPDPLPAANVGLGLGIDFSLSRPSPYSPNAQMKELVGWSFSLSIGGVPSAIEHEIWLEIMSKFDPVKYIPTAVPVPGQQAFYIHQILEDFSLGGATLTLDTMKGTAAGMTIAGVVKGITQPDFNVLSFSIEDFEDTFHKYVCTSRRGDPPMTASAQVSLSHMGHLSSVSATSPTNMSLDPFINASPPVHSSGPSGSVGLTLSPWTAARVIATNQPIQLLIRTTRGVRLIQFRAPPDPELDTNGVPANVVTHYFGGCLPQLIDPYWMKFRRMNPKWLPDPPPNWWTVLDQVTRFEAGVITVEKVGPGDVLTFDQGIDGGMSIFTRATVGPVSIPFLTAVRSYDVDASLRKLDRSAIGTVGIKSKVFQRVAVLETPGALSHALEPEGRFATITTEFPHEIVRFQISRLGVTSQSTKKGKALSMANGEAIDLCDIVKKPVEPGPKSVIPGLVAIHHVPGFETDDVAVAELDDGTFRSLTTEDGDSTPVVGGLLTRWVKMPRVSGNWAISAAKGDRLAVYQVADFATGKNCCDECAGEEASR